MRAPTIGKIGGCWWWWWPDVHGFPAHGPYGPHPTAEDAAAEAAADSDDNPRAPASL